MELVELEKTNVTDGFVKSEGLKFPRDKRQGTFPARRLI